MFIFRIIKLKSFVGRFAQRRLQGSRKRPETATTLIRFRICSILYYAFRLETFEAKLRSTSKLIKISNKVDCLSLFLRRLLLCRQLQKITNFLLHENSSINVFELCSYGNEYRFRGLYRSRVTSDGFIFSLVV